MTDLPAKITGEGYQEINRTLLLAPTGDSKVWAAPAFANRQVFVRNDKEFVCVSLAAEQ